MATVVVSEWIDETALARLRGEHHVVADPRLWSDRPGLLAAVAPAEALVVRNDTRVDAELLAAAPRLRVIGRVGVGLDSFDLDAVREAGVLVSAAFGANAVSVAEYVLGATLHLGRRFRPATDHVRGGGWDRRAFMGIELRGRTLGIVGIGDIGTRLARRARALGMHVVATDPAVHESSAAVQEHDVELVPLESCLQRAHVLSLHAPLTPATRGMIDAAALARMREGAILVNTARGGLVDEAALADALRSGRLAGAALDVRAQEPPGPGDPLRDAPNLLLTPHVAGVTEESDRRASLHAVDEVLRVLAGRPARTAVPGTGPGRGGRPAGGARER